MRNNLEQLWETGRRARFTARLWGFSRPHMPPKALLHDLRDEEGNLIDDHMWVDDHKIRRAGIGPGETCTFLASAYRYWHKGREEWAFGLERLKGVERASQVSQVRDQAQGVCGVYPQGGGG